MTEATRNRHLQQFWVKAVEGTVLYTNGERFLAQLERYYGDDIREKYDIAAMKGKMATTSIVYTYLRITV